ncbi:hypothetical protein [Novosphingobium aquimarinum]|uniref:hypothetical protein n=1 Tax=Novosphingobium aquimarinum TaxID=2682494 RepID=UPI0012EC17C4|nr:hypothetical protein [Novosphingobium aquimarinum]
MSDEGNGIPTAAIFGLLGLLGIGGAGILAMRSRRRRAPVKGDAPTTIPAPTSDPVPAPRISGDRMVADREVADREVAGPQATPQPTFAPKPVVEIVERVRYPATSTTVAEPRPVAATAMAESRDTQVLDREPSPRAHRPIAPRDLEGPVPTGAARADLLNRMVAAAPDESNPFVSPKARRRRARVILQHRAFLQRHSSDARFDWRTYRPTTKSSTPADTPMIPA